MDARIPPHTDALHVDERIVQRHRFILGPIEDAVKAPSEAM
jgi:hypothetical protein